MGYPHLWKPPYDEMVYRTFDMIGHDHDTVHIYIHIYIIIYILRTLDLDVMTMMTYVLKLMSYDVMQKAP